ncbi:hypothetical protein B0H10DRAFT_2229910 [Mycena sp. CBHHK59/15]|nr:hypothetical protein B0H10DRAFT_2229910 [Mycena sp. CBHHK59/15]
MIGHLVRTGITVGSYPAERRRMCRGPAPPASAESSSELGYGFVTTVILDHTCSSTAPATFPPPPAASSIPPLYLPRSGCPSAIGRPIARTSAMSALGITGDSVSGPKWMVTARSAPAGNTRTLIASHVAGVLYSL